MFQADDHLTPYPFPTQTLQLTDGTDLAVTDLGQGPKALVFVHGLSSSLMVWQKNLPTLSQHVRCVALDLPGHGRSSHANQGLGLAYLSSLVMEVIYRLGIHRANLVGHGLGGQVCLMTALRYPHAIGCMTLAAPTGLEPFSPLQRAALRQSARAEALARTGSPEAISQHIHQGFYRFDAEAQFMIDDQSSLVQGPDYDKVCDTLVEGVAAMTRGPVGTSLLHITQQTLVVMGEDDPWIPNRLFFPTTLPREIAEAGVARLPNGQLLMLPQCGHFVPFEHPTRFNQAVQDLISGQ